MGARLAGSAMCAPGRCGWAPGVAVRFVAVTLLTSTRANTARNVPACPACPAWRGWRRALAGAAGFAGPGRSAAHPRIRSTRRATSTRQGTSTRRLGRLSHGNPGRPQDALTDFVTGLKDLDARWLGHVGRVGVHQRFVDPRVEWFTLGTEADETQLARDGIQRFCDRLETAGQLTVFAGAADVIKHRQQGVQDVGQRLLANHQPVPLDALAVVCVLRSYPLQVGGALGQPPGNVLSIPGRG